MTYGNHTSRPGYGPPVPGQPGYPPPGYQYPPQPWAQPPPPPGPPHRPPPKRSRLGLWIGLGAGAAAFVVLAGCGVAVALLRSGPDSIGGFTPPSFAPASTGAPTTGAPPPPPKPAQDVTVVRPERIGTRERITEGEYAKKAANAEVTLTESLRPDASIAVAYYGTEDRKVDQIYIVGSTIPGPVRKSTFDKQFANTGPSIDGKPVTGTVAVPAGPNGGFVKCGQTSQAGMPVAVCAFSNEWDYVVVQWYNRTLSEDITKEVLAIRAVVEQ